MPPDLLADLARIDGIEGVKQANGDELQLIDGLALYAGDDATFARTLDLGGAGGILVASHIVGNEMRRMVSEPERRSEIDASLRDVYETLFLTSSPTCTKAALNMLGLSAGPLRLPLACPVSSGKAATFFKAANAPAVIPAAGARPAASRFAGRAVPPSSGPLPRSGLRLPAPRPVSAGSAARGGAVVS